jgi:hypothetical protein
MGEYFFDSLFSDIWIDFQGNTYTESQNKDVIEWFPQK